MSWHASDALTPIFADLPEVMTDDAACCVAAVTFVCEAKADAYCLTTHPGHHASAEHYGGYCFLNHAALAARLLEARGKTPFIVDVDYHAGDGTASFGFASDRFVSLHVKGDYPYCPRDEPWAIPVPSGATWLTYKPLLRQALRRRHPACDVLVVSLGFDTLAGDPDAREGQRLALAPDDFGRMRAVLAECKVPLLVLQEGGYHMEDIPAAAEHFWVQPQHTTAHVHLHEARLSKTKRTVGRAWAVTRQRDGGDPTSVHMWMTEHVQNVGRGIKVKGKSREGARETDRCWSREHSTVLNI